MGGGGGGGGGPMRKPGGFGGRSGPYNSGEYTWSIFLCTKIIQLFFSIQNQWATNYDLYFQVEDQEEVVPEVVLWEAVAVEWVVDEVVALLAEEISFNIHP